MYLHRNPELKEKIAIQYLYKNADNSDDLVENQIKSSEIDGICVDMGKDVEFELGSKYESGGAGITTSVDDYALFANALANNGIAKNGERIIRKSTIDLLKTNQLSEKQLKDFNLEQLKGYGYGMGVRTMIDPSKSFVKGNIGEFGWGDAAGATMLVDTKYNIAMFYSHHMLNPQEDYYQPRLRNALYSCF